MSAREYLANRLRHYRNLRNMSTAEVGDAIGKSRKTVSAWEVGRGQPDADMLIMLCRLYKIKISDLFAPVNEDDEEMALVESFRALPPDKRKVAVQVVSALR